MCGIFGYTGGDQKSALKALRGLKDLEYRGYDSWGIAVKTDENIFIRKAIGKISHVPETEFENMVGSIALGHTRWATHGGVSVTNAHPHISRDGSIAVVHNGIIENHDALREEIKNQLGTGVFRSETDTEVIPLLIEVRISQGLSFEQAFVEAARKLRGRFAFAAVHKDEPFILAVRNGSPLVVGVGEGEYFIASDMPAFLDYTNKVHVFNNGEYAKISERGVEFFEMRTKEPVHKTLETVMWKKESASKGGHPHFMLKEILEERDLIEETVTLGLSDVLKVVPTLQKAHKIFFTAMGTAYHMGMVGEYIFSRVAHKMVHVISAAEFDKALPFVDEQSVVCGISQSGETADLLEAFEKAKARGATIISIINVRGSSVERESLLSVPVNAGPERAVASTKAATAQISILTLLAYALVGKEVEGKEKLLHIHAEMKRWLHEGLLRHIEMIAQLIKSSKDLYVIGKSLNYPIALEAALKIKEVSYIHAEGFAAGELKHGTIALIEKGTPCLVFVSNDEFKDDVLSAAHELEARGALIIGVAPQNSPLFAHFINTPDMGDETSFAHMISSQILAYYLAVLRGNDPDKPRNLAKSVTVK